MLIFVCSGEYSHGVEEMPLSKCKLNYCRFCFCASFAKVHQVNAYRIVASVRLLTQYIFHLWNHLTGFIGIWCWNLNTKNCGVNSVLVIGPVFYTQFKQYYNFVDILEIGPSYQKLEHGPDISFRVNTNVLSGFKYLFNKIWTRF
jgi:hypothetical protein